MACVLSLNQKLDINTLSYPETTNPACGDIFRRSRRPSLRRKLVKPNKSSI